MQVDLSYQTIKYLGFIQDCAMDNTAVLLSVSFGLSGNTADFNNQTHDCLQFPLPLTL